MRNFGHGSVTFFPPLLGGTSTVSKSGVSIDVRTKSEISAKYAMRRTLIKLLSTSIRTT